MSGKQETFYSVQDFMTNHDGHFSNAAYACRSTSSNLSGCECIRFNAAAIQSAIKQNNHLFQLQFRNIELFIEALLKNPISNRTFAVFNETFVYIFKPRTSETNYNNEKPQDYSIRKKYHGNFHLRGRDADNHLVALCCDGIGTIIAPRWCPGKDQSAKN